MSRFTTLLGILIGTFILLINMFDFGKMAFITAFFDASSAAIVLGGVLAVTLVNYPASRLPCIFQAIGIVLWRESYDKSIVIDTLLDLSSLSRQKGKLALESMLDQPLPHFLKLSLQELLNTQDPVALKRNLDNEMQNMRWRHANCQEIFQSMAAYAPAFGMLGTVMGLILMMTTQADSNSMASFSAAQGSNSLTALLSGMGIALVTTFYGVVLANFIFLPIAGKLKSLSEEEQLNAEIVIVGMLAIQRNESPMRIKDELYTFVSEKMRMTLDRQSK